jgi:outer membrane protein assembly factor BamB
MFTLVGAMFLPLATSSGKSVASFVSESEYYAYHSSYNQLELNCYTGVSQTDHSGSLLQEQQRILDQISGSQNSQPLIKGPLDSPWPMVSHDVYHTGRSPYNTTQAPEGVEIWRFYSSDSFDGGAVIDKEGILYFGGFDWYFYALYPNGTVKWKTYLTNAQVDSTPAIDENGILYIGTKWGWPNYFFAVYSNNGTIKWRFQVYQDILSSPAIGDDGTIYFGTWDNWFFAFNPDGTMKWEYKTGDIITGSPALGPDGTVYIGSHDSHLYAFNPENGTVKWSFPAGGWVRVSPCIGDDGTVYCVSFDNYLYAIYPNNGTMKWRTFVNAGTNPTIGPDGTIYAGWDVLYAVNPIDGSVKWTLPVSGAIEGGTPCTSREGVIYFGTSYGSEIIAVNPNGTLRWRHHIGVCQSPPAIGADGTIYIGSESPGAAIHAFGHGPLNAEANGPYNGAATIPIQFTGDIFGGIPPYTCHWDFGDNQSSSEQNPKHAYAHYGIFTATFTVTDSQGNHSTDTANVTVHFPPPTVRITKPVNGIYFMNMRILPFNGILIFGPITVNVEASQEQFGINRVEFYIDNDLKATDTAPPYSYTWRTPALFKHYMSAKAFDNSGNFSRTGYFVWKFF